MKPAPKTTQPAATPIGYLIRQSDGEYLYMEYPFDGVSKAKQRERVPLMAVSETQAHAIAWTEELEGHTLVPVFTR